MNKRSKCCCKNYPRQREIIAVRTSLLDKLSLITEASVYQKQRKETMYFMKHIHFSSGLPRHRSTFCKKLKTSLFKELRLRFVTCHSDITSGMQYQQKCIDSIFGLSNWFESRKTKHKKVSQKASLELKQSTCAKNKGEK